MGKAFGKVDSPYLQKAYRLEKEHTKDTNKRTVELQHMSCF